MCFMCDGGTYEQYQQLVADHIERFGWHIAGVEPEGMRPAWAYTIGMLERYEHPELIITGLCCFDCGQSVLNAVGRVVADGGRLAPGDEVVVRDRVVRIGSVHPRQWETDLFNFWWRRHEMLTMPPSPAAVQVIIADAHGRWQDDRANRRWRHERLDAAPHVGRRR
ncbi:MAG TPA: DUF4262 domain-containing protein [Acidimicrobiales bacterium]|nr:DUF4262 domain-containing protein [Acidimicrobiales bacterium]